MAALGPRSALITGANRGLGLELVRQMAECRSAGTRHLLACCRHPDGPRSEALQELAKRHPEVITVLQLDTTDLGSIKQCSQKVGSLLGAGGLNLLINNAGIIAHGTMQTTSPEDMLATFDTNVMGPMNVTKEFLPHLRAAAAAASGTAGMSWSKAAVINISSVLGSIDITAESYSAYPALAYRVSKVALNMMTVCAAQEFQQSDILFAALHPGWVKTDMGGEAAEIEASESVGGMLRVMDSLTEKQNGAFLNYKGMPLSW